MSAPVVETFLELATIASPPGQERAVADRVVTELERMGIEHFEDGAAEILSGSAGNLVASIPGSVSGGPRLLFCAHLDTVPEPSPIVPTVADGMIRSDGETILGADNKAAVAVMLEAAKIIVAEDRPHCGIDLVFTVMEEVGCRGAAALDVGLIDAELGFVYDYAAPIGVYVATGPSGYLLEVEFIGRPAHAGIAPEDGRSAVVAAATAIRDLPTGRLSDGTTANVGLIAGGTAHNVVPERCAITIDVRSRTKSRAENVVDEILATCASVAGRYDCRIETERTEKYRAYSLGADDPVVALATAALRRVEVGMTPVAATGGADSSVFNARGLPCLNLANGMAEIHTSSEHIAVADLELMLQATLAIVAEASASGTA